MTCRVLLVLRIVLITLPSVYLCYAAEHPTRIEENSNCFECHANKVEGKYVHTAIKQGCTVCHVIENKGDTTYVTVKQSPSVCFACHQQEVFLYEHLPYSSGWCLRCHDPHASGSPNLVRGNVNDLCLACHLKYPESVASRDLPTIVLTVDRIMGHPYAQHPVSGKPDALTGLELSCVSCHTPHGGAKRPLLKMGEQIPEDAVNQTTETNDMCRKCHMVLWGVAPNLSAKKKNKKGDEK